MNGYQKINPNDNKTRRKIRNYEYDKKSDTSSDDGEKEKSSIQIKRKIIIYWKNKKIF